MALVAYAGVAPTLVTVQSDGRTPVVWRALEADEDARFHLGHAVFNTSWIPAGEGGGRRDGLSPLFNAPSCDACHNSRRRGRGPQGDGPAPSDLVLQVARRTADGIKAGHPRFGHIFNTDAIEGFVPEAEVLLAYDTIARIRADGSTQTLHSPRDRLTLPGGDALPDDLVLKTRMASQVLGAGLLEQVSEADILAGTRARRGKPRGAASWIDTPDDRRLGRFGWQATEPDIASQTATAFAREMGLTTDMIAAADCGWLDTRCREAPQGGRPEVETALFEAVVAFQQLEAMRRTPDAARHLRDDRDGATLFARTGCADCHRPALRLRDGSRIAPYTDLLLHDLGPALADRDVSGAPVPSLWRTAPLWGMGMALEGGRPVRLLHDGRARSIEEAIGWHDGNAADARARFDALTPEQRAQLIAWISAL